MADSENTETEVQSTEKVTENQPNTPKPGKKLSTATILSVILAIGLLGGLGYLYNDKANQVSKLKSEVAQLKLAALTDETSDDTSEAAPLEGTEITTVSCSGSSEYTADIGKFTVSLSSPYVIIRNLDAGFEGGPITSLDIATCLVDETNVFDSPPQAEVNILAHPASSASDLRASYEGTSGSLTADGTVTVGGVTADKYVLSGLFETTVIYFDNAGIGYQIELSDTNTTTNAILTDLITDWVFTP